MVERRLPPPGGMTGEQSMRHGYFPAGNGNAPKSVFYEQGKFGRLFPTLPPFATDTASVRNALDELGKAGGIMDAGDDNDPSANPTLAADLIVDKALGKHNRDNPR